VPRGGFWGGGGGGQEGGDEEGAALRLVDQCFEGSWQRRMVVVVAVDSHAGCSRRCCMVIETRGKT
jgi:hypothetical protein